MTDINKLNSNSTIDSSKRNNSSTKQNISCPYNIYDFINIAEKLKESDEAFISKAAKENFIYNSDILSDLDICNENSLNNHRRIDDSRITSKSFNVPLCDLSFESVNHLKFNLIEIFKFESIIGEGTFGVVVKAKPIIDNKIKHKFKSTNELALKIIPLRSYCSVESIIKEVEVLMSICINNSDKRNRLIKVYNLYCNSKYVVIEMEYISGVTLREFILERYMNNKPYLMMESEVGLIMKGIIEAISVLHSHQIIHRDIKPENIMILSKDNLSNIKLIDLGLFTRFEDSTDFCYDKCGTLYYMAPEMLYNKPLYNELVDLWACGIILYILLSGGCHPVIKPSEWNGENEFVQKLKINKVQWRFKERFSYLGRNLFLRLCNWNKFQRIDSYLALKHPFITRNYDQKTIPVSYMEQCAFKERKHQFILVRYYIY